MKRAHQQVTLISIKRQSTNLKRILTRAKFNYPTEIAGENFTKAKRCKSGKCGTCNLRTKTSKILFNNSSTPFKIKENMNCTAEDIIYVIKCAGCSNQYIGETGSLRDRVRVHKQQIFTPHLRNLQSLC